MLVDSRLDEVANGQRGMLIGISTYCRILVVRK